MADAIEVASAYIALTTKMPGVKKDVAAALGEADGVSKDAGKRSGAQFAKAAAAAIVAGTAIVTAAVGGLYAAGGVFDDVSDTIRVGTGAVGDELDSLVSVAHRVGAAVPAEFSKVGSTVADLNTRLGLSGDTLQTVASQYLEAGRLLGQDVDIQTSTAALNAFQIAGEDVSGALDTVFRVSQATGIGMNELFSTVQTAAPLVQNLGFSFDETASLIGALDKAGLDANRMLMTLGPGLVNMARSGEQPAEVFPRVIAELQSLIEKGDVAAAIDIAGGIFGTRGAAQFVGAIQSGVVNLQDLTAAAGAGQDTILGLSAETSDAAESWQVLKNNALLALEPISSAVFNLAGQGLAKVVEWAQQHGPTIAGFFETLTPLFDSLLGPAAQLWTQLSPVSLIFQTLAPILPQIVAAFMPLGPILAQVAAMVGGLMAEILPLVATLISELLPAVLPLVGIFLQIAQAILPIVSALLPPLVQIIGALLVPVVQVLAGVLKALSPIFSFIGSAIAVVSGILQVLAQIFAGVVKTIVALIKGDMGAIPGIWQGIWDKVTGIVKKAWNGMLDFAQGGVNGLIGLINGLIGGVNDVTGALGIPPIPRIPKANFSGLKLAEGGIVPARPGGTLAMVGEGRYSEAVLPLSPKVLDALGGGRDESPPMQNTFNLPPTDPHVLARLIARELKG